MELSRPWAPRLAKSTACRSRLRKGHTCRISVSSGSINQIQLKATTSASYVRDAIEQYPYIDVVTLEDLKGHFALTEYSSEVTVSTFSNQDLTEELMDAVDFNIGSLPPLIAMGFIVFSAYREKDLTPFQRNTSIGDRGSRLGINAGILMVTGLPGIPLVFTKEYLLKKGRQRKAK